MVKRMIYNRLGKPDSKWVRMVDGMREGLNGEELKCKVITITTCLILRSIWTYHLDLPATASQSVRSFRYCLNCSIVQGLLLQGSTGWPKGDAIGCVSFVGGFVTFAFCIIIWLLTNVCWIEGNRIVSTRQMQTINVTSRVSVENDPLLRNLFNEPEIDISTMEQNSKDPPMYGFQKLVNESPMDTPRPSSSKEMMNFVIGLRLTSLSPNPYSASTAFIHRTDILRKVTKPMIINCARTGAIISAKSTECEVIQ